MFLKIQQCRRWLFISGLAVASGLLVGCREMPAAETVPTADSAPSTSEAAPSDGNANRATTSTGEDSSDVHAAAHAARYRRATEHAARATQTAQQAASVDDWQLVVDLLESAIAQFETIPPDHSHYDQAQAKVAEYQPHLQQARQQLTATTSAGTTPSSQVNRFNIQVSGAVQTEILSVRMTRATYDDTYNTNRILYLQDAVDVFVQRERNPDAPIQRPTIMGNLYFYDLTGATSVMLQHRDYQGSEGRPSVVMQFNRFPNHEHGYYGDNPKGSFTVTHYTGQSMSGQMDVTLENAQGQSIRVRGQFTDVRLENND